MCVLIQIYSCFIIFYRKKSGSNFPNFFKGNFEKYASLGKSAACFYLVGIMCGLTSTLNIKKYNINVYFNYASESNSCCPYLLGITSGNRSKM